MKSKTVIPLFDNVLVKPLEAEVKTASGIYLPETAKEAPQMGEVVAVGEGELAEDGKRKPMEVKVGQTVMYTKWGGNEVKIDGKEWKLVKQTDILAIIK